MSTKASIKYRDNGELPGFHLYDDMVDGLDGTPHEDTPVYLELEGIEIRDLSANNGWVAVTVVLPREMARALGLLPKD